MQTLAGLALTVVKTAVQDGVGFIEMARPPANAQNLTMIEELAQAILVARFDPSVKVAVVTSTVPRFFSAGLDIAELDNRDPARMAYIQYLFHESIIWRARTTPKVFIAAITGNCLGGGLETAMACDIRIGGKGSWLIGHPEVRLGGFPGGGGVQVLGRLLGFAKALRIGMFGENLSMQKAHEMGILDELVDQEQVIPRATELARQIAASPTKSIGAMKINAVVGDEAGLTASLAVEREAYTQIYMTDDLAEGARAFKEKRPPVYKGR
jgi:enoyl-CoA hydratase/carnithine racemase